MNFRVADPRRDPGLSMRAYVKHMGSVRYDRDANVSTAWYMDREMDFTPLKINMTMENQPFEDVSPIQNGGFSIAMLVFRGILYTFALAEDVLIKSKWNIMICKKCMLMEEVQLGCIPNPEYMVGETTYRSLVIKEV